MKDLSCAKKTLAYYMKLAVTGSGRGWDEDNQAEVNGIMEEIENYINEKIEEAIKGKGLENE